MKKCNTCHREINDEDIYCPHCGAKQFEEEVKKEEKVIPLKKRSNAMVLAFFLGCFGLDDLYLGFKNAFYIKFGLCFISMGIMMLPLMVVGLVNFFRILFNKHFKDAYGRELV